jgi:hypothetical protein
MIVGSLLVGLCAVGSIYAKDGQHRDTRDRHYTYGDAQLMLNSYPPIHGPGDRTTAGLDIRPFAIPFFQEYRYCVKDWHVFAIQWRDVVLGPFNPVESDCLSCPSCEDCIKEAWFPWDQEGGSEDPDPLDPFDPEDDVVPTTPRDAFNLLGGQEAVFYLDGVPVPVVRTSVNQIMIDEDDEVNIAKAKEACYERYNLTCDFRVNSYGLQWGSILEPDELSVGEHTFRVVITYLPGTEEEFVLFDQTMTFTVYEHDESYHGL